MVATRAFKLCDGYVTSRPQEYRAFDGYVETPKFVHLRYETTGGEVRYLSGE